MQEESDESDKEGFVSHPIRIDSQNLPPEDSPQQNTQDLQPRYIIGEGILKKQPSQCYLPFRDIPARSKPTINSNTVANNQEQLQTAYEVYKNNKDYIEVYSRFRNCFKTELKSTFQHEVKLNTSKAYEQPQFKTLKPWKQQNLTEDINKQSPLLFDSRFESGNLRAAFRKRKDPNSYVLFMQNDTNTYGFNQWFYFSVRNAKKHTKYTFQIANFKKPYSFFTRGMQPLLFSLQKARTEGNGWYRDGNNISYYPSNFREAQCTPYYTLEFQLTFEYDNDYLTISPYPPYSFSRFISSIKRCESFKIKTVGYSLARNPILSVTLSAEQNSNKPYVVILARQHPGQTWSSFLSQKIMEQLLQHKSEASKWLLKHYNIRFFPMVNVDGVIYGNFRCDLAGYDLNRCWKQPIKQIHPQIYHIRREISLLTKKSKIELCIDLHTHSKDLGAFAYCCVQSENCRALPQLIGKISPIFRFPACTFGISADKQNTARSTVFGLTHNINTLTIQLSAFGFKNNKRFVTSYTPKYIQNIGKSIIKAFHSYTTKEQPILINEDQHLFDEAQQLGYYEYNRTDDQDSDHPISGSDSQPEIDEIALQLKIKKIFPSNFMQSNKDNIIKQTNIKTRTKKQKIRKNDSRKVVSSKQLPEQHKIVPQKHDSAQLKTHPQQLEFIDQQINYKKNTLGSPRVNKKADLHYNKQRYQYSRQNAAKNIKQAERPFKQLNLVQFSLKKLPLFSKDKLIEKDSNMLIEDNNFFVGTNNVKRQYNRFDKTFSTYEAMCRPRVRNNSKQLTFSKQKPSIEQELPFLCIMSQTKKQLQIQKMNEKIANREQASKNEARTFHNSILNGHRPHNPAVLSKYREKRKNIDPLSKMRIGPYTRYEDVSVNKKQ